MTDYGYITWCICHMKRLSLPTRIAKCPQNIGRHLNQSQSYSHRRPSKYTPNNSLQPWSAIMYKFQCIFISQNFINLKGIITVIFLFSRKSHGKRIIYLGIRISFLKSESSIFVHFKLVQMWTVRTNGVIGHSVCLTSIRTCDTLCIVLRGYVDMI